MQRQKIMKNWFKKTGNIKHWCMGSKKNEVGPAVDPAGTPRVPPVGGGHPLGQKPMLTSGAKHPHSVLAKNVRANFASKLLRPIIGGVPKAVFYLKCCKRHQPSLVPGPIV